MKELPQAIPPRLFWTLWFLALGWAVGVAVVSAIVRVVRGKPVFMPEVPNALFCESWRSGRSYRNWFTRASRANNCLWIAVVDGQLRIGPHFPFTLAFLPEIVGVECRIDGDDLISVEQRRPGFGGAPALVRFRRRDGTEEAVEVWVRDAAAFRQAIERIRPGTR